MTLTTLDDLEAAMKTAKEMGHSKISVHIFVLADLLAKCRELVEMSEMEKQARRFVKGRRA